MQQIKIHLRRYLQSPEKIALAFALAFSLASAFLVPQLTVNDENSHFLKAYSLSSGKITGSTCTFPQAIVDKVSSMSTTPYPTNLFAHNLNQTPTQVTCGSAASYSPIMHIPQAIGIGIGRIFNASPDMLVLLARIANALFYSFALFYIIKLARIGKWVLTVIGLFPFMIHTAGSVSADTMNSIIVLGSLTYIFSLFTQKKLISKKQSVLLIGVAVLLALSKPTNAVLLLPLVALPVQLFPSNKNKHIPINIKKWTLLVLCGVSVVIVTYILQKAFGSSLFIGEAVENPLKSNPLHFFYILYNTYLNSALGYGDMLIRGLVGEFSSFQYHIPTWILFAELSLLSFVLLHKKADLVTPPHKNTKALAITSAISLVLLVLVITFALYSAWAIQPHRLGAGAIYADGVQGRYFTAALATLIPVGIFLRRYIWIDTKSKYSIGLIVSVTALVALCSYIIQTVLVYS